MTTMGGGDDDALVGGMVWLAGSDLIGMRVKGVAVWAGVVRQLGWYPRKDSNLRQKD